MIKRSSLFLISIAVLITDQFTKIYFKYRYVEPQGDTNQLIGINVVKNYGAAFSIFSNSTSILAFISLFVSTFLFIYLLRNKTFTTFKGVSLALLMGGSIGNGIDRFRLGYVIDFIQLNFLNFPIFNIADISINIALVTFLIHIIKSKGSKLTKHKNK